MIIFVEIIEITLENEVERSIKRGGRHLDNPLSFLDKPSKLLLLFCHRHIMFRIIHYIEYG